MKLVLDADVVIDYLRRGNQSVYVSIFTDLHEVVMSMVTVAEVFSGQSAQKGQKQGQKLIKLLEGLEIKIPSVETARFVGGLRSEYKLSLGDGFVAALALELNLPLLTLNVNDFKIVKGLKFFSVDTKRKSN